MSDSVDYKFKGLRVENREWVFGSLLNDERGRPYIGEYLSIPQTMLEVTAARQGGKTAKRFCGIGLYMVRPETVGQFTGSYDKRADEIYRGDIVKAYLFNEAVYINPIEYRSGTFWFGNWNWVEFLDKFRNIERVGNKFDIIALAGGRP